MPRSNRSLLVRLGATLLAAVLVAGVALAVVDRRETEPTAAEAGETLKTHILTLLNEVFAQNIQITDAGGKDIPCPDDRVKRTFAATGLDSAEQTQPRTLNLQMLSALNEFADYEMTGPGDQQFSVVSENTKTSLHLNSSENGRYAVSGETDCLNPS
ncbi:hypothetical protein Aph01nite_66000 [Acrocarpospora phusangensis]|uniref:Uncharacterized protein n=1 Tax=Acrocarpospora phusangensis TaxID=1070424 RepID=A0A919QIZ0_9ACTN|nr:hypothetical protein [Acrocarpospora phusangensis]GIH28290.1 hypothetical protein Aph01nite_66000 [Acrocarpospora phusangensis]